MRPQEMKKLADLFHHDLSGWVIARGYGLGLRNGSMGMFSAITNDGREIITPDKDAIKVLSEKLLPRVAEVTSSIYLVCMETGEAFILHYLLGGEAEPFQIFSGETIKKLDSVYWK